jgi:hypothetical protein
MARQGKDRSTVRHGRHPSVWSLGLLLLAAPLAQALDCAAIADEEARLCCDRSRPKVSMTQTVQATMLDAGGTVREVGADLAWKRLAQGEIGVRVDVTAPPGEAGTIVLLVHRESEEGKRSRRPQAFLYDPNQRRERLITVDALAGSLLGTDFSYEDFAFIYGVRTDLAVERLADEVYEGIEVIVLDAVPNDPDAAWDDGMRYSRVVTRLDRARCVALNTRFYERDSEPRKELVADLTAVRQLDDRWLPYRSTMNDRRSTTHTVATVEKASFEQEISDFFFARSALKRGR